MVTHETKCFLRMVVVGGEMVEFLKELEPSKVVDCIDEISFLFSLNGI